MRYTVICLKLLLVFLLLGCKKKDTTQNTSFNNYANLYARYLIEDRHIKATATFSGGKSFAAARPIAIKGGVSFYGHAMKKKQQEDLINYILEIEDVDYNSSKLNFYFNNKDGQLLNYQFETLPIRIDNIRADKAKTNGIDISFSGGTIKKGQQAVILFTDAEKKAYSVTINGPIKDQIKLSNDQIADWPIGDGKLCIVKKDIRNKNIDEWEIKGTLEYYSRLVDITIAE